MESPSSATVWVWGQAVLFGQGLCSSNLTCIRIPWGLVQMQIVIQSVWDGSLRICLSKNLPGHALAGGLGTTL